MSKKYKKPQPTRTLNKREKPPAPKKPMDRKLIMAIAFAAVTTIILTAVLIWYYSDRVVARAGDIRIRGSEVRQEFAANTELQNHFNWGNISWEGASEVAARQIAINRLVEDYARQNGIALTGNESSVQLMNTVTNAIVADDALFAYFEAYTPEDEIPPALLLANDLLTRLHFGEDFDALVAAYGEDPGMRDNPEGYVFIEGAMVTEFFEATRIMEIGEISAPVLSEFGFHIIKRVEPSPYALVAIPGGSMVPQPLGTDDELLAAKHILISARATTPEQRMHEAVSIGFGARLEATGLEFLSGLYNIPQP